MKKILKAVVGFLALLTAGCNDGKQCGCCHHSHDAITWNKDGIYRIALLAEFDKTKTDDCIALTPRDQKAGYIGLCYGSQVANVIKKHYNDNQELVVLELDVEILKANGTEMRSEVAKEGGDVYPHLYGTQKIQLAAVKEIKMLKKDEHGEWEAKK